MSKWREKYKVHPAADAFPMMSDEDLAKLGEDIKANGLRNGITFLAVCSDEVDILLDGRNRLEAMERVGVGLNHYDRRTWAGDPVAYIIGQNIHRRHLTSSQLADILVRLAAIEVKE